MSRKTRELEARVVELEKKLGDINRNIEYISNKIHTAVQIELDEAWQTSIKNWQTSIEKLKKQLGGEE